MFAVQEAPPTSSAACPPHGVASTSNRLLRSSLLSPEERQALADAMAQSTKVAAHTDLVREGGPADTLFIITQGWGCRYATTRDGGRQLPALLLPGDVANLDTLMFDRLVYGVRTLTAATVISLPRDQAIRLAAVHPGIAGTFTRLAMVENIILSQWTVSLGRRLARDRLAHLLCELAVRLRVSGATERRFGMPLTQEQLADVLGLTSVHVNRMMKELRDHGLVVIEGRTVSVPDFAALSRSCGFDAGYLHCDSGLQP